MSNRQPSVRLSRTPVPPPRPARADATLPFAVPLPDALAGPRPEAPRDVELHPSGATLLRPAALDGDLRAFVLAYFHRCVLPVLTPMTVDAAHPFPRLHEGLVCVAQLSTVGDARSPRVADLLLIPVPRTSPRWVALPVAGGATFVRLEDVVRVGVAHVYGLARLHVVGLGGAPARRRIEHGPDVPAPLLGRLRRALGVDPADLVVTDDPLAIRAVGEGDRGAPGPTVAVRARSCA